MRYRALIVGAGRMGAGLWDHAFPYCYDHASTYLALKDRIELVGFADPNRPSQFIRSLPVHFDVQRALETWKPDIVSICTPDGTHKDILIQCYNYGVKGVWCEKPYEYELIPTFPVQVNYCRLACEMHRKVKECIEGLQAHLYVWARKDWTTIVHFASLARWLNIPKDRITYVDNTGEYPSTNSYRIEAGKWAFDFRNGGCKGGFMERMLGNLLDAVEGKAELISPASEAIESELLAKELLNATGNP